MDISKEQIDQVHNIRDLQIIPPGFDTDVFRKPAIKFQKDKNYVDFPVGSGRWLEYWNQEKQYCLDGIEVNGVSITGFHYFYLNYCPIKKLVKEEVIVRGEKRIKKYKKLAFPDFYDYDKYYFDTVENAQLAGEHLVVLKARRKGYSFKAGSMLMRNFYLKPASMGYVIAAEKRFLTEDGTLSKAWSMMDHLDQHTAWHKHRQAKDTMMHKRASYYENVGGIQVEVGYKSEILGVTIKNDAQKIRGISADLIFFEEAGKNPNLVEAWMVAESSMSVGIDVFGLMIAFGTGGSDGADFAGLKELFYKPKAYGCYGMKNIWDISITGECGFFVPDFANHEGFIKPNGESMMFEAFEYRLNERKKMSDDADQEAIDRAISEHPFNPMEATFQARGNIFPGKKLMEQLTTVELSEKMANKDQCGELFFREGGGVKFEIDGSLRPILEFPTDRKSSKGCLQIWEHPYINEDGVVPKWLYILGNDPYDQDNSTTDSLGSTFVWKRFLDGTQEYNIIVAEYTGRPNLADEYYEVVRMLALYYNGTIMYENNIKGLHKYFSMKRSDYLLADTPETKDVIRETKVNRGKGIHMTKEIIAWGEQLIKKMLLEFDGKKYGYEKIYSIPLLKELIAYNKVGNFDRVRALMCLLIYNEHIYDYTVKKQKNTSNFIPVSIWGKHKSSLI